MQKDLTILSLNIGHGMLLEDLLAYVKQKTESVDVFCFQEADGVSQKLLNDLLGQSYCGYYADKDAGKEYFSLATYVRRDFAVNETNVILDTLVGAGLALASAIAIDRDTIITVINVHGHPRPGLKLDTPVRIEQSQTLIKSAYANKGVTVFAGDFNLIPETLSIDLFAQNGYKNLISEFDIPTTRNEIVWNKYPDSKQLYADYAFIQDDESLQYDFAVEDVVVSDHLPLVISVTLPSMQKATLDLAGAESASHK